MPDEMKRPAPVVWGVWSEDNDEPVSWFNDKTEAVEAAKALVQEQFGVRVHLFRAVSVGTIEVPAIPVTTGEMTATKTQPASSLQG